MPKLYRTAMGRQIDIDQLSLSNENVIAVGNYKVNARGDELGPGGKIVKTRDQVMREYYALNTPVAADPIVADKAPSTTPPTPPSTARPAQEFIPPVEEPVFNAESGMDEIDDGPSVTINPEVIASLAEIGIDAAKEVEKGIAMAQPVPQPPPQPVKQTLPPPPPMDQTNKIRGSLANSVAKGATVVQPVAVNPNKPKGVQRF